MTAALQEMLSAEERGLMEHALGWPKDSRNNFVTEPESIDGQIWRGLVARGLATASKRCAWMGDMVVYRVTEAGRALIAKGEASNSTPAETDTRGAHCPVCSYTLSDCQWHGDHHLCKGPGPKGWVRAP